jgi:hypothetical protein
MRKGWQVLSVLFSLTRFSKADPEKDKVPETMVSLEKEDDCPKSESLGDNVSGTPSPPPSPIAHDESRLPKLAGVRF